MTSQLDDQLGDQLLDCLVSRPVGHFPGWLVDRPIGWMVSLVTQLTGQFVGQSVGWMAPPVGQLTGQ